jgi:hypothetical protein
MKRSFTVAEETAVARQWQSKHVSTEANIPATIEEPREAVSSLGSVPRLYNEDLVASRQGHKNTRNLHFSEPLPSND